MAAKADPHLVAGLGPSDRVAVIAGGGELPRELARSLVASGQDPYVIVVGAENEPAFASFEHATLEVEEYGRLAPLLHRAGVTHLVMAGSVARRPRLRSVRLSFGLLKLLPRLLPALGRGDDALLRAIVGHMEAEGLRVIGSHQIVPDILAPHGPLTKTMPRPRDEPALEAAFTAARTIGELDIGQAAVAVGRRVVALEGVEGTAAMLARVKDLRASGRIATPGGVLVKCAKPNQELRADLPTIGPDTVGEAHAAGLDGIAVEAGRAIVLQRKRVAEEADRLGLFVVGMERPGP